MATKPTSLPTWATTAGTTVEPSAGQKAAGFAVGTRPPARWWNWLMNVVYQWCAYLLDGIFVGESGQPGITATGGASNGAGGVFTGNGSGNGITVSTGTGGKAVVVTGSGNQPAIESTAGSGGSARALKLTGGSGSLALEIVGGGGTGCIECTNHAYSGNSVIKAVGASSAGSDACITGDGGAGGSDGLRGKSGATGGHGLIGESGNTLRGPLYLKPMASVPSAPIEGMIYPNSTDHKLYFYDGSAWVDLTA